MEKKTLVQLIIILILVSFLGYNFLDNSESNPNLIDSNEFENLIDSGEVFVINAHVPYVGEIDGTDLIAEHWENINSYADQLPKDKNTPLAIYCRSGRMSSISAQQLKEMGYKNIYDLEGGMKAWEASGRELLFK